MSGKLVWPLPLEALVLGAAHRAGLGRAELVPLGPWLARAAAGGATPARGPLAHELQLPNQTGPHQLGLNVFAHESAPIFSDAERWAAYVLGPAALGAVRSLPDAAPDLQWHGGIRWDGDAWRLKLYGSGSAAAIAVGARQLGADLAGVERGAALIALGIDVTADGLARARTYERMDVGQDAPEGTSHQLLGRMGGARAKHTVVTSFFPGVSAAVLREHDVDPTWLDAMVAGIGAAGFSLDAAAHELDLFDDGSRATDVFVTIGTGPG